MKILEIEDNLVPEVVAALVKRAKYFENAIEANGYGNLAATGETVAGWQKASDDLWALVRSLGKESPGGSEA